MLLQKLLWPRVGICTEDRLYYRMKAPSFRDEGDILRIEQGERVCFDTYLTASAQTNGAATPPRRIFRCG